METIFIIYLVIAAAFGLFMSAMTGQTSAAAMSFFIVMSMLILPILIVLVIGKAVFELRSKG